MWEYTYHAVGRLGRLGKLYRNMMVPPKGSNLRSLADMSPEEIAALERRYGCLVRTPKSS
jgi:hypothetical protein